MPLLKYFSIFLILLSCNFLSAQTGLVNFDGMFAPTGFSGQNTPADSYSDGIVTFTGDWKVLDCTSFVLSGYSPPNGLKFNTMLSTSNFESINFSVPVNAVSFNIGVSASSPGSMGMIQIEVFDNLNNSLETQMFTSVGPSVSLINIASSNISRIDITVENAGVVDDIGYTIAPAAVPTLSQWGLITLLLIFFIFSVVYLKERAFEVT